MTHVDAQFSLPYTVAVALCKNRAGVEEFKGKALTDREVLNLAGKVTCEFGPEAEAMYPKAYPAALIATLNDGRKLEARVIYAKGDPENPVSSEEILDKFHTLTGNFFLDHRRREIIGLVSHFERTEDVSRFADLVR